MNHIRYNTEKDTHTHTQRTMPPNTQPLPVMGSLGLEPSVGPAVAEAAPGAGALPKEISMGLWALAEWMDRWTVFE